MAEIEFCAAHAGIIQQYPALLELCKTSEQPMVFKTRTMLEHRGKYWVPVNTDTKEITVHQLAHLMEEMARAKESGADVTIATRGTRYGSLPSRYTMRRADDKYHYCTWDFVYRTLRVTAKILDMKCEALNSLEHVMSGGIGSYKILSENGRYAVARVANVNGGVDVMTMWGTPTNCMRYLEGVGQR